MQASMENSKCLDARVGFSVDGSVPSTCNIEGSSARGNYSEKSLLDEIDSYWDELNTRLTISRMVSDSIIKGMVNAVVEEAANKITLKEAELAFLNERLQYHESDAAKHNGLDLSVVMPEAQNTKSVHNCSLHAIIEQNHAHHLERLRISAEEQLQRIKEEIGNLRGASGVNVCSANVEKLRVVDECTDALEVILSATYEPINNMISSLRASASEQQWEQEMHNLTKGLQDELEAKLCEQRGLIATVNKKWQEKIGELSTIRQELDAFSRCLFSSEPGLLVSHNSLESLEECNTPKRKDHFGRKVSGNHHLPCASHAEEQSTIESKESSKPTLTDSPQLKCMSKDDLIAYFRTEMAKMKRQHDLAVQEKTEELFSLKREFLKEKGSSPLHFRRDKELELLMRKITEFMSKLDGILLENENLPIIHNDQAILCSLKERIDTLFFENQRLQGLIKDKTNEARCFASQVSDAESQVSHHLSTGAKFVKQIKKLQSDVEDVKIETTIGDEINKLFLKEVIGEVKSDMEGLEMEIKTEQDIYSMIFREVVGDALSSINPIIAKSYEEMNSVEARFLEKEKALSSEIEENMRLLKQEIASLSAFMKENEKFASEAESTLIQQKERFDLVRQELDSLSDQVNEQEKFISESKKESDLMRGRLDEALQQIHQYKVEMNGVNQKLKTVSDTLDESEKQKIILHSDIHEKQKALESAITKEKEQKKCMKTIISSMTGLSKAILDSECRLADNIKTNESRLKLMNHQCVQLLQQANLLKRKELWNKQRFESKCSDLQKAETEVDLLGDEVDALLSLLEKIYIALDHYSPVLQHYPGVVETLKLIEREMKGGVSKLV